MEQNIQYLIYTHAVFGGIALTSGSIALIAKKGNRVHRLFGKVFYYTLICSITLSLFISLLPGHENPFLFSIGLFSAYLIIGGYRSLKFKNPGYRPKYDKLLAGAMIVIGCAMIIYGFVKGGSIHSVLLFFGLGGIALGIRDLMLFYRPERLKKEWLIFHLTKMTGGYIASVTAFFVVNNLLPGILDWFAPTIVGSAFIVYWTRKLQPEKKR